MEEVNGAERIKNEKLKKQLYNGSLESNIVEQDEVSDVEQVWEQVKWAMVDSSRVGCGERTERESCGIMQLKLQWRGKRMDGRIRPKER